jgi:hypothetical protein
MSKSWENVAHHKIPKIEKTLSSKVLGRPFVCAHIERRLFYFDNKWESAPKSI